MDLRRNAFCRVADPDSNPDPDSIGSVDPDPDSESGSRRAKITPKSRKKFKNFLLRAEGFFGNLDVFMEA